MNVIRCDQCSGDVQPTADSFHLERIGVRRRYGQLRAYDFCSLACLKAGVDEITSS